MIKPLTLVGWRTYVPEPVIQKILTRRIHIKRTRALEESVTIPNFAYKMPRLPKIEQKPEVFAMAIDTEGSVIPRTSIRGHKITGIDRWLYKYEYYTPRIFFATTTYPLTEKIANMLNAGIYPAKRIRQQRIIALYYTGASSARAIRAACLMQPYTLKFPQQINQILTLYRKTPSIRI